MTTTERIPRNWRGAGIAVLVLAILALAVLVLINLSQDTEQPVKPKPCPTCRLIHLTSATAVARHARLSEACTLEAAKSLGHNASVLADYKAKAAASKKAKAAMTVVAAAVMGPRDQDEKSGGIYYTDIENPSSGAWSPYGVTYPRYSLRENLDEMGECKLSLILQSVRLKVDIEANGDMPNIVMLATDPTKLKLEDESWNNAQGQFLFQFKDDSFGSKMVAEGLREFFQFAFSDETTMRLSGWLLDDARMWQNLGDERKALAKAWLPDFYRASKADMAGLLKKVQTWDNTPKDKRAEGEEHDMYWEKHPELIVETYLLRTWMRDGGHLNPRRANDLMVMRRFWMVMLAYKVSHPKADTWASEVAYELQSTSTLWYKGWYVSTLSQKAMPPVPKTNSLYVAPKPDAGPEAGPEATGDASPPITGDASVPPAPDSTPGSTPDAGPPPAKKASKAPPADETW